MTGHPAFAGKTALVTGAGSGIGAALAAGLATRGCRVAVTDRNAAAAEKVAAEIDGTGGRALAWQLDVTDRQGWVQVAARVAEQLGPVSVLCSNAGVGGEFVPVLDLDPERFRWLFDVNVVGTLHGVQQFVPGMVERGEGAVLVTASMASLGASALLGDYSASKHALLALAESLHRETASLGVTTTVLCPAAVATALGTTTREAAPIPAWTRVSPPEGAEERKAALIAASGGTITPEEAAERALDDLAEGRFLSLTHPHAAARARERGQAIEEALALFGTIA